MKQQMLFHYPGCWNPLHDRLLDEAAALFVMSPSLSEY